MDGRCRVVLKLTDTGTRVYTFGAIGVALSSSGFRSCLVFNFLSHSPKGHHIRIMRSSAAAVRSLRRLLHAHPRVSNREADTATRIVEFLRGAPGVELLHCDVHGGHGLVFQVLGGDARRDNQRAAAGAVPTVLLRADMDALPLTELSCVEHKSTVPGAHHACGHDGHTAMLAAALLRLGEQRADGSWHGRVIGIFQPAEETGDGAMQMLAGLPTELGSPTVTHGAFGMHNIPGAPLGQVLVRKEGTAARVSVAISIRRRASSSAAMASSSSPSMSTIAKAPPL